MRNHQPNFVDTANGRIFLSTRVEIIGGDYQGTHGVVIGIFEKPDARIGFLRVQTAAGVIEVRGVHLRPL